MDVKENDILDCDTVTIDLVGIHPSQDILFGDDMSTMTSNIDTKNLDYSAYDTVSLDPTGSRSTVSDWVFASPGPSSSKITLSGQDADIDINGVSLMQTLRDIQTQLHLLQPDASMEQEWDELRKIREQYEAKLKECREKSLAWKALKS